MIRFIFLTDIHIGATKYSYFQMPRHLEYLNILSQKLKNFIKNKKVDFIISGGDLTEHSSIKELKKVISFFNSLEIPFYTVLGNHDMCKKDSIKLFEKYHLISNNKNTYDYWIEEQNLIIYLITHHWNTISPPFFWNKEKLIPKISNIQKKNFINILKTFKNKLIILILHSNLNCIPKKQTHLQYDTHIPDENFKNFFIECAKKFKNFKLVVSGHTHINSIKYYKNLNFATCSTTSFTEFPFEFKLIKIKEKKLYMKTFSLYKKIKPQIIKITYDKSKKWVLGRKKDRNLKLSF